jgi:outer membrane protein OmpA-like peptidoglycan-associated protein
MLVRNGCISAGAIALCAFALGVSPARAQSEHEEPWYVTGSLGVTGPLNDPATELFNVGGDASFGVYRSIFPEFAVGARLRTGILSEGGDIAQDPVDRGQLDYGYIGTAIRLRPFASHMNDMRRGTGFYLDLGPGLALLDGDVVPAYEAGLGYNFAVAPVMTIGPMTRFTHFIETHGRFGDNHILTWVGGVEMTFGDGARDEVSYRNRARVPPAHRVAQGGDRDGDWILDTRDDCPDQAETYNGVEDADGCPEDARPQLNEALVVDERVFFDYDESDLRPAGREQLNIVADHYRRYGDRYETLVISGHTDARGSEPYNADLSRRRARVVLEYLTSHGVPAEKIDIRAYGEERPAVAHADTEFEHQVNRRVEFRVNWRQGAAPIGIAPTPSPTMPDYVDEAPRPVQERERRLALREQRNRDRAAIASADDRARRRNPRAVDRETDVDVDVDAPRAEVDVDRRNDVDVDVDGPRASVDVERTRVER